MSEHRGRFQVQGNDMKNELSRKWHQETPRTTKDGLSDIDSLKGQCTKIQLQHRDKAFDDASRFVKNAHPQGVKSPVSRTFQNWNLPRQCKTHRVDLEVKSGIAFI